MKVVPSCHAVDGEVAVLDPRAYSTVWLPGFEPDIETALTVIELAVTLLCVGVPTAAPLPLATELIVTVPVGVIADVASLTCDEGILEAVVSVLDEVVAVLGVPVILIRTSVPLWRDAVPALSPSGKFVTVKFDAVIELTYVPLLSVYETYAPLTA